MEIGGVEEEDLPDLRLERVEAELGDGRAVVGRGNGQFELDAVGLSRELEQVHELLVRQASGAVAITRA